ncbi:hypothetical protein ABTX99_12515 [Streptomyces flaveolus]|uniref:hypothetical protein n=1 Tax=Streptomyces flaveolus TaxID=67297 RepID=UPI00332A4A85
MSPNRKKAIAVIVLFLVVDVVALICGIAMSNMGSRSTESVVAGAGAWAVLMAIGVPLIALFDFKDDRWPTVPPIAQQAPPNQPGAPVV